MRLKPKIISFFFVILFLGLFFPRAALADTFTLSGNVSDSTGADISSADINVTDANTGADAGNTTTDNSGNYSISIFVGGTYNVQVTPPAGSNFSPAVALSQNISANKVLNFILVPAGSVSLSGHIYDILGNPIPGEEIQLMNPSTNGLVGAAFTDSLGTYSMQVAPGIFLLRILGGVNNPSLAVPQQYALFVNNYSLNQSKILDITIPTKKVTIHVQDQANNPVSNVDIKAGGSGTGYSIGEGITDAFGFSGYNSNVVTDNAGNTVLWLLPNQGNFSPYTFTATPPAGSIYLPFILNNIIVTGDQTEVISLQFIHDRPITIATLSPAPNAQEEYSDPTTVTLSATAASGFTIANTYYTVDGSSQQTYLSPFQVSGDGQHTITFWSIDNVGVFESPNMQTFTIHINQPADINIIPNETINEGDTYSASGSFTDPDSTSWTATVDYGDGSGIQPLTLSGTNFSLNHVYKDNGIYTATVSITDNQGASDTESAVVTINNVTPTVSAITAPADPVQVNTTVTASGNFTDLGVLDTHTAVWNWGDGTTSNGTVTETNGSGTISDNHTYTAAGVYTITLTVTDKDGAVGSSTFQYVVVYDPNAGFLTGAGQYDSLAGWDTQNTQAAGKVIFGVSSKYTTGNAPTGQSKINFKAGGIDFDSTSYQWLVISGSKATLKGNGTVNGSGNYTFIVSGIDGSQGGQNLIRVKITDSSNNVIYDTQSGAADTADPTTPLSNGVIKVH